MKTWITGCAGQVGRALVNAAPEEFELQLTAHADLDIAHAEAVGAFVADHKPDLIINAAAYTAVDLAETEQEAARGVNETGPANLARAAADTGARLIHISTDFVFDGESATPYLEDATTKPLSVYGQTKLAGERAVADALPDQSVILRTAWVYAASGRNFVLTMLRLMQEHGLVRVVSDQQGSPTSANSIAEAIWVIAQRPEITGIWHWTAAGVASWYEFAVAIAEEGAALGLLDQSVEVSPITTEEYPTPAHRPRFSVLDCSRTVDAIGIQQPHWRDSLRRILKEIADAQ